MGIGSVYILLYTILHILYIYLQVPLFKGNWTHGTLTQVARSRLGVCHGLSSVQCLAESARAAEGFDPEDSIRMQVAPIYRRCSALLDCQLFARVCWNAMQVFNLEEARSSIVPGLARPAQAHAYKEPFNQQNM